MKDPTYLYSNGLPFTTKLAENIDDGLLRVENRKATCIIIDGGVGEGKTTLAVEMADYINAKHGLPEVDLKPSTCTQIGMGGKQFSSRMRECFNKGLPVVIYDEAGDYARKQAMTSFNAYLNRIFETYRAFKIIVIICLPNQFILDNTLFDNKIPRMLLHLEGRGKTYGNIKGYSLHRAFFIRGLMRKIEDKNFAYRVNEPNFYAKFKDLPPERSKLLDELTISGKINILQEKETKLGNLLSINEIAQRLNLSHQTVRNLLRAMNFKYSDKIGKTIYYSRDVLDKVIDYRNGKGQLVNDDNGD